MPKIKYMISKIIKIENVGLFSNGVIRPIDLKKIVLVYAENGRGKSTLAAILRSTSQNDPNIISARKTIDSPDAPLISLLINGVSQNEFKANVWQQHCPWINVFDSEFVDSNVYSGSEVRPDHRQSLLDFALGDEAVELKKKIDQLTHDIEEQTRRRTQSEKILLAYANPFSLDDFITLKGIADAQKQIEALQQKISDAGSIKELTQRKNPSLLSLFEFDANKVFTLLAKQISDLEQNAEDTVKEHIIKHPGVGLEDWISKGLSYQTDTCSMCGQSIAGVDLIRAYKSFFNKAYADLKQEITTIHSYVASHLSEETIKSLNSHMDLNTALIEAWKDKIVFKAPVLNFKETKEKLKASLEAITKLIVAKQRAPLEAIRSKADETQLLEFIKILNDSISEYNETIASQIQQIEEYKKKLTLDDITKLREHVIKITAAGKRNLPEAAKAISDYQTAESTRKRLDGEKEAARKLADTNMKNTLDTYQGAINEHLKSFGAEFTIDQLKSDYTAGRGIPGTAYCLKIRERPVKLGNKTDKGTHCFATTLSEGDKRTLAISLFISKLEADPRLQDKVIVLDDPVSSLDRNRRLESINLIAKLSTKCKQLILLSHDPFFIKEVKGELLKLNPTPDSILLKISRIHGGYSAFDSCDIEDLCSSPYYSHYRLVTNFVNGDTGIYARSAAEAIRPLVEGYLHRKYPEIFPKGIPLGQIIELIKKAAAGSPLSSQQHALSKLVDLNKYASVFHHDTNPGYDTTTTINEAELLKLAKQALEIVYS